MRRVSPRDGDPIASAGIAEDAGSASLERLRSLLGREVEIRAVFGEKSVPLGDLAAALPGTDLLLLPRGGSIRLLADGIDIGEGTAVEIDGRLAVRIDRLRPLPEIAAELGGALRRGEDSEPSPR